MARATDRLSDTAGNVRPYVERAVKDEEVREHVRNAFEAARDAYNELIGGRTVTTVAARLATDEDMQDNLKRAVEELKSAADRIQGKNQHRSRNTLLLLSASGLGVLFNPMTGSDTRRWIRERISGGSSDFSFQDDGQGGASGAGGMSGTGAAGGAGTTA